MQIDEFEDLLDRHGDNLAIWPAAEREAASALLKVSDEARELLEDARSLRAMFGGQEAVAAPAALASRILADARRTSPAAARFNWLRPTVMLAVCCVAGFGLSFVPSKDNAKVVRVDLPALFSGLWQ